MVEEVVNPLKRSRKSDVERKSHLCVYPEGRKHVAHWGNCKYFATARGKSVAIRDWRGGRMNRPRRRMFLNELFVIFR